jgi:hypothetical protein
VIEWALSLKGKRIAPVEVEEITPPVNAANDLPEKPAAEEITSPAMFKDYAAIDAGAAISDPVVRELYEANRKRRQFPAKHVFSRTLAVEDGRTLSLATCTCGHTLKFVQGDEARMCAAEEAHWRRFPEGPTVDGRGQPIVPGDGRGFLRRRNHASARVLTGRRGRTARADTPSGIAAGDGHQTRDGSIVGRPVSSPARQKPMMPSIAARAFA